MTGRRKVLLYPRVSSQDQLGNNSLPMQKRAMAAFAERKGFGVWKVFEGVWISLGSSTPAYFLSVTTCKVCPEPRKPIAHVHGP